MENTTSSRNGRRRGADRLDPVRWSPARRRRLVRAGVVTALLMLAVGVLLAGGGPAAADRCVTATARPRPTGPPGSTVPAGSVGVAVRVGQPGIAGLVRPGNRVDLTVARSDTARADVIVRNVLVLRGTSGDSSDTSGESVVYLAMSEDEARRVAGVEPAARIGITLRPG